MGRIGTPDSRLLVLRGNSGSGKTTTARRLRHVLGRGVAWVEQDHLRRILLREWDRPGAANIGLIDLAARYALEAGFHVIVEGILDAGRYGDMLRGLGADHAGTTGYYYFDVPFPETLARHATRPLSAEVTPEQMREWYRERDLLGVPGEQIIGVDSSLSESVARITTEMAWMHGGPVGRDR